MLNSLINATNIVVVNMLKDWNKREREKKMEERHENRTKKIYIYFFFNKMNWLSVNNWKKKEKKFLFIANKTLDIAKKKEGKNSFKLFKYELLAVKCT